MGTEDEWHSATEPFLSGYVATAVCGFTGFYGTYLLTGHALRPFARAASNCDAGPCDAEIQIYLLALVMFFSVASLVGGVAGGIGARANCSSAWLETGVLATMILLGITWLSVGLLVLLLFPVVAGLAMSHQLGVRWHERRTQTKGVVVSEEEHTLSSSERGDAPGQS